MSEVIEPGADEAPVESNGTALVPADAFAPGTIARLIERIRADALAEPRDVSTEEGRKLIKQAAYRVARSKVAIDEAGKAQGEEHRAALDRINEDRRTARLQLSALQAEILAPLTAWEQVEQDRIAALRAELDRLSAGPAARTSAVVGAWVKMLCEYPPRDWQEFAAEAAEVLASEADRWAATHAEMLQAERDAAELAELRAEKAKRDAERAAEEAAQREEAELKARQEAAAAAQAKREAEAKAEAERQARMAEEAAERAREEVRKQAEVEAARAAQREADAIARAEAAEREAAERAIEAQARAEAAERDAAQRALAAEAEAERRAEAARQAAIVEERRRVEKLVEEDRQRQAKAAAEAEKRAQSKARQTKVNREALAGLIEAGLTEDLGKAVIAAIALGKIPHVSIGY